MKSIVLKSIVISFVFVFVIPIVVSASSDGTLEGIYNLGISTGFPDASKTLSSTYMWKIFSIWATVVNIVQMLSFAAIIFAGLRYMFASADRKAEIKRSLGILSIGAVLVFATSTIIKFVVGSAEEVIK